MKYLLLICVMLAGCATEPQKPQEPQKAYSQHWVSAGKRTILGDEWDYVCASTGRMDDAQVTFDAAEKAYKLWSRGTAYGEYDTLAHAQTQGEYIVRLRMIECAPSQASKGR